MGNPVVFPAEPRRQGESRSDFPFILEIGHVERAAQPVAAPRSDVSNVRERGGCHFIFAGEGESIVRGLSLILTRRISIPVLRACRPWTQVKLSTTPYVVPTSTSSVLSLSPTKLLVLTANESALD